MESVRRPVHDSSGPGLDRRSPREVMIEQRGRLGRRFLVAALVVFAIAIPVGLLATRPSMPAVALAAPRFVDEAVASGLAHAYPGTIPGSWAVAWRPSTATAIGSRTLRCRRDRPGGPVPERQRGRRSPAIRGAARSRNGSRLRAWRLSPGHRRRRARRPCRPPRRGERDPSRPRQLPLRARERGPRARGAERLDGRCDVESEGNLPTLAFGQFLELDADLQPTEDCDHGDLVRPPPGGRHGPAVALRPGYCIQSLLFSDWDRSGRRDLRVTNDREYYPTGGEEQSGASSQALHPACTPERMAGGRASHLGYGDREPGHHWRRPARGLPLEPGRQQATDPGRRRHRAGVHGHRPPDERHGPPAICRRRGQAVDGLASGVRRRQQRWLPGPVRQQGQRGAADGPRPAGSQQL